GRLDRVFGILQSGRPRLIDSGLADGHPFFSIAGLGFEAEIAQRFNELKRRGFARYLSTGGGVFKDWQASHYTGSQNGRTDRIRAFTVTVANSCQYGNSARIAPAALIDDGALDLVAVPPLTVWNTLPLIARLFAGRLDQRIPSRKGERFVV